MLVFEFLVVASGGRPSATAELLVSKPCAKLKTFETSFASITVFAMLHSHDNQAAIHDVQDPVTMAIIVLLFLLVYFGSVMAVGYAIFSPFKTIVSNAPQRGMRIHLIDILAFFISFQLGFAALNIFDPDINWDVPAVTAVTIFLFLICGLAWFYGMRLLWRMNVEKCWLKRIVLLGLVMPIGCVIPAIALPILVSIQTVYEAVRIPLVLFGVVFIRCLGIWIRTDHLNQPLPPQDAG